MARRDPEQMTERQLLHEIVERLTGLPSAIRQALSDDLWAQIPNAVTESGYAASLAAATNLDVVRRMDIPWMIETVLISVPPAATGTVFLSDVRFPVPAGVTVLGGIKMPIGPTDTKRLVIAGTAGPAGLWVTGSQRPPFGVLTP